MQSSTDAIKKESQTPSEQNACASGRSVDVMLHLLAGQECVIKAQESRDDGPVDKEVFVSYLPQPWPSISAPVNSREGWDAPLPAAGSWTCRFN